jgi:hypothetical protein
MHCELVVPGLFGAGPGAKVGTRFAALELLLARGRSRSGPAQRLEGWLHEAFDFGEAPFPAGALTLLGCGGDPGEASWARADPVHLRVMRDHLIVVPSEAFDVSRKEAEALCEALNRHFTGTLRLEACDPRRWCARLSEEIPIDAQRPLDVSGRDVNLSGATRWHALLNEAQMVLHEHPVNEAREARGEPAVNSIWLWGAGRVPQGAECPWQSVAANDPAALGAARLAGARHRALPRSAQEWLERLPEDGRHLAVIDALRAPLVLAKDTLQAEMEVLEREWFEPLLAALRSGRIGMVTLHVPDGAEAVSFETVRGDLRRFWRLAKSIEYYA